MQNPILYTKKKFNQPIDGRDVMSFSGVMKKVFFLFCLLSLTGFFFYYKVLENEKMDYSSFFWSSFAVLVILIVAILFRPRWAKNLGPLYALCEGVFLGSFSGLLATHYPNLPLQALPVTFLIFFSLLILYQLRIIKVGHLFINFTLVATTAVTFTYLVSFSLSFFGINMPYLHDSTPLGILIGFFLVGLATFNLLANFELINKGVEAKRPKNLEWFYAVGLILSLVWLYMELLSLLMKFQEKKNR